MLTSVIVVAACAGCLVLLIRTGFVILKTPRVLRADSLGHRTVSVLVPVRNEASRILSDNIRSLLRQTHAEMEIVAVDDRSTDDTYAILARWRDTSGSRLRVIRGQDPPRGWMGKVYALEQAKALSHGEWLVFADADVIYEDGLVASALAYADENKLDALSLLPRVLMISGWEQIVIPVMCWLSLMRVSTTQANRESSRACFGYGNFIMVRRTAHDGIGGFKSYCGDVLDDCAVMERLKRQGHRVRVADGMLLMRARMYSTLGEIFLGFGKNAFAALRYSVVRVVGVIGAEALCVLLPPILLFAGAVGWVRVPNAINSFLLLATAAFAGTTAIFGRRMGARWRYLAFYPVGHAIAILILCYSMARVTTGRGLSWKGRTVLSHEP